MKNGEINTINTEGIILMIATYDITSESIPNPFSYFDLSRNNTDIKPIVLNTPLVII